MKFSTVYMDPPWAETGGGVITRGAQAHYPVMSTHDIHAVISTATEWRQVADDAHLYMWVTNNFLDAGLRLIKDLDFRPVTNIVWVKSRSPEDVPLEQVKLQTGLGQYFRGSHELLIFAVRGKGLDVRTAARDIGSVVIAPRGKHSAKPHVFYDLIEARSQGPYLEMFARNGRAGWTSWGNQAPEQAALPGVA